MKRVLVIIDNMPQYEPIKNLILKSNREDVVFDFHRSKVLKPSKEHGECLINSLSVIDVVGSVDFIIKNYDLVISIHCTQIFPKSLVENIRCINVHPGYNPINRGWYPQIFSLAYELPIGVTIHEIDNLIDHGPIIARKLVDKALGDTSATLYKKILKAELELLEAELFNIVDNKYKTFLPEEEGRVYLKKDFEKLCEIDLNETGTFKRFYNLLRALSHEGFNNAYIVEKESGKKIFLRLVVNYE